MIPVDGQMMDMMDSIGSMEKVGLMEVSERIGSVYGLFLARFGQIAEKALTSFHKKLRICVVIYEAGWGREFEIGG